MTQECADKNGQELKMKESCREALANHTDPESSMGTGNGVSMKR